MPFGKYKGWELQSVPQDYLIWVLENCDRISGMLRLGIMQQLNLARAPVAAPRTDMADIVRRWFRQLALDYHPDRGGSTEIMAALNEAHERLKMMIDNP